jgi:hypothetical protein
LENKEVNVLGKKQRDALKIRMARWEAELVVREKALQDKKDEDIAFFGKELKRGKTDLIRRINATKKKIANCEEAMQKEWMGKRDAKVLGAVRKNSEQGIQNTSVEKTPAGDHRFDASVSQKRAAKRLHRGNKK